MRFTSKSYDERKIISIVPEMDLWEVAKLGDILIPKRGIFSEEGEIVPASLDGRELIIETNNEKIETIFRIPLYGKINPLLKMRGLQYLREHYNDSGILRPSGSVREFSQGDIKGIEGVGHLQYLGMW